MNKYLAKGNFLIPETLFKSIMIVVGSLVGVYWQSGTLRIEVCAISP
jgi:hypothetical protein